MRYIAFDRYRVRVEIHRGRAMVRHARAALYENVSRPVLAVGNDYAANHQHPSHSHRRSQLLHAMTGTMVVSTDQGSWIVPPQQGLWIPGGIMHGFRMIGAVSTRSVYLEPDIDCGLPSRCCVLGISKLLQQLLMEAVDVPVQYEAASRGDAIMNLILHELRVAPRHPLTVPFPVRKELTARCGSFLERPSVHETIDDWAAALAISRRGFTRLFRAETGLSFAEWQRRVAVLQAVHRLARGEAVTTVALDLGYSSPAAFTSMFKRVVGVPPSRHTASSSPRHGSRK
jgi:AraC-like DNA-binding protein